jgi:hypothetical protein
MNVRYQIIGRYELVRSLVSLLVLALAVGGCTSWQTSKATPQQLVASDARITMKLILAGAPPVVVSRVTFSGDTLHGYSTDRPSGIDYRTIESGGSGPRQRSYFVSVPQSEIQSVQLGKTSVGKTVLLIVTLGVTVSAVLAVDASSGWESSGSCPVILTETKTGWRLDSGTYAGAIMPALTRSDVDNLDYAADRDGLVRVRLTGLSAETEYVDGLTLIVADHDPAVTVAPDGRGRLRALGTLEPPAAARDLAGRDALPRVAKRDEWCWESALVPRRPDEKRDLRDGLDVRFRRAAHVPSARLVIDGANTTWADFLARQAIAAHGGQTTAWYDSISADTLRAGRIRRTLAGAGFLHVSLWTATGWEPQGSLPNAGIENPKRQVVPLDLTRVKGDTVLVRLECVPNIWLVDCVSVDYSAELPIQQVEVPPVSARSVKGSDVLRELVAVDGSDYVISPSDTADVAFRAPPVPEGRSRTYLARTTGWYRMYTQDGTAPQVGYLNILESGPDAVARFSIEQMNRALSLMAAARGASDQGGLTGE